MSLQGSLAVVVAPVLRFIDVGFNADVRIEEIGPPDKLISGFAPELFGSPLAVRAPLQPALASLHMLHAGARPGDQPVGAAWHVLFEHPAFMQLAPGTLVHVRAAACSGRPVRWQLQAWHVMLSVAVLAAQEGDVMDTVTEKKGPLTFYRW